MYYSVHHYPLTDTVTVTTIALVMSVIDSGRSLVDYFWPNKCFLTLWFSIIHLNWGTSASSVMPTPAHWLCKFLNKILFVSWYSGFYGGGGVETYSS